MQTIMTIFKDYGGTGYYTILFVLSLIYLGFTEEDKRVRTILVYIPAVMMLLFFLPVFYVLYNGLDSGTYYRILWLMPMTVVIAYAGCKLIGHHVKLGVLVAAFVLIISGTYVYKSQYISKAENLYHLPQETIEICDMIKPAEGAERVWAVFPVEQVHFVRQYTTTIQMPYGRESIETSWGYGKHPLCELLLKEYIPADELSELSIENDCHYIILLKKMKIDGNLGEYDIELIGETENYLVYRNTPVEFFEKIY